MRTRRDDSAIPLRAASHAMPDAPSEQPQPLPRVPVERPGAVQGA
ncbi:hypothetical protein Mnod_0525 [Methylobacterium nodulans ORS 2060]|uniref:Uncharacterized protein n=1 Tax=Methylobacterium nodulans (strain LMG 21967 / CNCM I-2342 / ORS 2060) TaxID=460265 RepID=B8ICH8_METNO|nr:hypothetical protein Mnod_0525 [Methylobacterium nodulans ORS 2060]